MDQLEKPHKYTNEELKKLKLRTVSDAAFLEDGGEYVNSAKEPRLEVKQSGESIEARNIKAKQLLETITGNAEMEEPSPEEPRKYDMYTFWSAFNTEEYYGTVDTIRGEIVRAGQKAFLKWFRQPEPGLTRWKRFRKSWSKKDKTRTREEIAGYIRAVGLARNDEEEENWFNYLENRMYPILEKVRLEGDTWVYKMGYDYKFSY